VTSLEFKMDVLDHWVHGKTARQISMIPYVSKKYTKETGKNITRNVIIGIVNRAQYGHRQGEALKKKVEIVIPDKPETPLPTFHQKKSPDKYRERKCLQCKKLVILPRNRYRCDDCHRSTDSLYGFVDGYSVRR